MNLVPFVHLLQPESLASSLLSVCLSVCLHPFCACAPRRWESSGFGGERSLSGRRWLHPFLSGRWEALKILFPVLSPTLAQSPTLHLAVYKLLHCKIWQNLLIFPLLGVTHIFQWSDCPVAPSWMHFGVGSARSGGLSSSPASAEAQG